MIFWYLITILLGHACGFQGDEIESSLAQRHVFKSRPVSLTDDKRLIFAATLDGTIHAVDVEDGHVLWSLNTGPMLSGSQQNSTDEEPMFVPDPRDGALYVNIPNVGLRRVNKNIRELVEDAPFTAEDGSIYLGQKRTDVHAIDVLTGQLHSQYLDPRTSFNQQKAQDADHDDEDDISPNPEQIPPQIMFIGRTEYSLAIQEAGTGRLRLNITLAYYANPDNWASDDLISLLGISDHKHHFIINDDSIFFGQQSDWQWQRRLGSTILGLYVADEYGSLGRIPTSHVRFARISHGSSDMKAIVPIEGRDLVEVKNDDVGLIFGMCINSVITGLPMIEAHPSGLDASQSLHDWLQENAEHVIAHSAHDLSTTTAPSIAGSSTNALALPSESTALALVHEHHDSSDMHIPSINHILVVPSPPNQFEDDEISIQDDDSADQNHSSNVSTWIWYLQIAFSIVTGAALVGIFMIWRFVPRQPVPKFESETDVDDYDDMPSLSSEGDESDTSTGFNDGTRTIGKLTLHQTVLGHGSHGTIVYKASYDGRTIAVKRMLREFFSDAPKEVELLRKSDHHPNVIRYFCQEQDKTFLYIGLELCLGTLTDFVEGPSVSERGTHHGAGLDPEKVKNIDKRDLAHQIMSGIQHLHKLHIVHRDMKPHNVLISQHYNALISDFGLGASLKEDQSSYSTMGGGTFGWTAPEALKNFRTTKAVDIFSTGCVLHYLMHSKHPFGDGWGRQENIRQGRLKLSKSEDKCMDDLFTRMVETFPEDRPNADQVLNHPYFWTDARKLQFLMDVSDRVEKETSSFHLIQALEQDSQKVIKNDWSANISEALLADLLRFRKYNVQSIVDLLRAARNKKHHYQELSPELKASFGSLPNGFFRFFDVRFPYLFIHVYNVVRQSDDIMKEPQFEAYFSN